MPDTMDRSVVKGRIKMHILPRSLTDLQPKPISLPALSWISQFPVVGHELHTHTQVRTWGDGIRHSKKKYKNQTTRTHHPKPYPYQIEAYYSFGQPCVRQHCPFE